MTRSDDPRERMARLPSPADVDRLLSGNVAPDDLPDESASLARLLAGMRELPAADVFTERRIVSEMTAAIVGASAAPRVAVRGRRLSAKAGALAFVAVLATGTAAAAANGSLPPRIQRAVSDALSHLAITVPHPGTHHDQPSHNGGGAPGSGNEPVAPRGVHNTDDDQTPRGATKRTTPGVTTTVPSNNGRHVGGTTGAHGGTNPNQGPGNDSGNHTGSTTGQHNGTGNGQHNGADNGNGNGNGNANGSGNGNGQKKSTAGTTPTTVKSQGSGGQNSNASGNGNGSANSHASLRVSVRLTQGIA